MADPGRTRSATRPFPHPRDLATSRDIRRGVRNRLRRPAAPRPASRRSQPSRRVHAKTRMLVLPLIVPARIYATTRGPRPSVPTVSPGASAPAGAACRSTPSASRHSKFRRAIGRGVRRAAFRIRCRKPWNTRPRRGRPLRPARVACSDVECAVQDRGAGFAGGHAAREATHVLHPVEVQRQPDRGGDGLRARTRLEPVRR